MATLACQFCGCELLDNVVLCQSCSTPHHKDCFECNRVCTTYACGCSSYETQDGNEKKTLPKPIKANKDVTRLSLEKSLGTPTAIPIEHKYNRELGIHSFTYDESKPWNLLFRYLLLFFILGTGIFSAFVIEFALFLTLLLAILLYVLHQSEKARTGQVTIDEKDIKFTSNQEDRIMTKKGDDPIGRHPSTQFVGYIQHTVERKDIEEIDFFDSCRPDYRYCIRVKAPGKVRRAVIGKDKLTNCDAILIHPIMDKSALQWLANCLNKLSGQSRA